MATKTKRSPSETKSINKSHGKSKSRLNQLTSAKTAPSQLRKYFL